MRMRRPRSSRFAVISMALLVSPISIGNGIAAAPPQIATCASCHGVNGMGNLSAGFPALAGLPAPYIERQLTAFKHGERKNAVMQSMANPLDAKARAAIAAYYATLPVPATPEPTKKLNTQGEALAMNGVWGGKLTGVPACDSCHGPYGIGVGVSFPRLAGQPQSYISAQLTAWKNGSRTGDPLHLMSNVATQLSAAEISAVSAFYASLSPNPTTLPGLVPDGGKQ